MISEFPVEMFRYLNKYTQKRVCVCVYFNVTWYVKFLVITEAYHQFIDNSEKI